MKIRHRIMIWVAGAGLLTSLVFSLVVLCELREQSLGMMDSQLQAAAGALAEQLTKRPKPWADMSQIASSLASGRYWIKIYDQNHRVVYQSELSRLVNLPWHGGKDGNAYMARVAVPKKRFDLHQGPDDEITFRVRTIAERIQGLPYLVQIAKSMGDFQEDSLELLVSIGIGLAVSTVLLAGLSYLLAGRIVKPIAAINRLARDINENTLEQRIPLGKSRDEIYELTARLNDMFDRLQFSFDRQKRLLADASHELKSPIAMLRLFFDEAMQRHDLPEAFQQQLNTQGRNVLRLDRLVRRLLELSILEIKPSLTLEAFDFADLARGVAEDFVPILERTNIRLKTVVPEELEFWGDKERIRQSLINLFDNAVKYNARDGSIELTVIAKKHWIQISLCNTGPGIPREDLAKVFDQFYRVEQSRSERYGGAGLGLSIVREIIHLHQGKISIDSKPSAWTKVDILLPQNRERESLGSAFEPT